MKRQLKKSWQEIQNDVDRLHVLDRRGFNRLGFRSLGEAQRIAHQLIGRFESIAERAKEAYIKRATS